jgi:hypothetical protein
MAQKPVLLDKYTLQDLLSDSANDLMKRKGFGHKALCVRYEKLRDILNGLVSNLNDIGVDFELEEMTQEGWVSLGKISSIKGE